MSFTVVKLDICDAAGVVLGACHNSNVIDLMDSALKSNLPEMRYGIAFYQHTGRCFTGLPSWAELANDNLGNLRVKNLFVLLFDSVPAKSVLTVLKDITAIEDIYCAASGPVDVIVNDSPKDRIVIGLANEYSVPS